MLNDGNANLWSGLTGRFTTVLANCAKNQRFQTKSVIKNSGMESKHGDYKGV